MKCLMIATLSMLILSPALAQHAGHGGHDMDSMSKEAKTYSDSEHEGHVMDSMPDKANTEPHAGHNLAATIEKAMPPEESPPPEAFKGPEHAATTVYPAELFLREREQHLIEEHGGYITHMLLIDQLEIRVQEGDEAYAWDAEFWYGGDLNRLWLKSEGEGVFGASMESAEIQALYSRAISPYFNLQTGLRYDFKPKPQRAHVVLGVQGVAPYWFELDAAAFLSDEGELTGRIEAEYDLQITQKLIFQPRLEANFSAEDIPKLRIGAGLSSLEAGLRLRYEIKPEFAPYIGIAWEGKFGDTKDFARTTGTDANVTRIVIGIRSWF